MEKFKKHQLPELNQDVIIPYDWDIFEEDNLISIFEPQFGVGVLQLSIYYVEESTKIDLKEEFFNLVSIPNNIQINVIDKRSFFYAEFENNEDTFWRYWLFRKNEYIVFASYNCSKADMRREDAIVDAILNSLM
jgi:hypothetical protein